LKEKKRKIIKNLEKINSYIVSRWQEKAEKDYYLIKM
jgi:hypothetical protein